MSSTRSVKSPGVIASGAATSLPGTPVAGASYRDATVAAADLAPGWKYGLPVDSAAQNEWMFRISSLIDLMDHQGLLGWCNLTDYYVPALTFGSDGNLYQSLVASGPSGAGPKDPISNPAYWRLFDLSRVVKTVKRQVFSTAGSFTYTPSAGLLYAQVEVVAGGAGGGGASSGGAQASAGAGGGAGGFASGTFSAATIGAAQTVTVGAAGSAGSSGGGNGGNGGTSSFGALMSATGGAGGAGGALTGSVIAVAGGGAGGAGTGGSVNTNGSAGNDGWCGQYGGLILGGQGGQGGSSARASGGPSGFAQANAKTGGPGAGPGAGGAGAATGGANSAAGGAGQPGIVVVTEFCSQ